MATAFTQSWTKTTKQICRLFYENISLFPRAEDGTFAQSGSVALEPKTGGVRGVVGQVADNDKTGFRNFNYATQSKRSPGSTIKPLVVFIRQQLKQAGL
ncbi:penicillin-binding protein 2A [Streptococcus pneumoniae]|nr:penicillin-binding protein 2A [Streptococcus pneumoniae]